MVENQNIVAQQQTMCPEGCCTGDEILCVSIPCPISIVLLGIDLQLELPCLRLTSGSGLTAAEVQRLLAFLTGLLGSLGYLAGETAATE